MKTRLALVAAAAGLVPPAIAAQAVSPPPERLVANIDTQKTAAPVSPHVFGMFIEHIGRTMYGSLWAEMLDDRKFYFPIVAKDPEPAGAENPMARMMRVRPWRPIGGEAVATMDRERPFVGEQSPRIALDPATAHGIRQTGLALVKGRKYTGRIVVKGAPGAKLQVALVWGSGAKDRQVVPVVGLAAGYRTVPLRFLSQADATDAAFEVTGTGSGSFHVGAVSLMPADNVEGYRPDTIALIRQVRSGFWRFGGNYISNYNWYDAVGDRDRRAPSWDFAWNAMQTNDLGMDEFMALCRLIEVEPYISVNAGFGDARSAADQVEYMNGGATTTRMGALRARNGHPAPYKVRFWNIGNEPWGSWQLGRTDTKYFVLKHNEFAKAMRRVDPKIVLIASGLMLEDGSVPGALRAQHVGNLGPLYGTDADWTGSFLKHCWGNFDGIAEHWYASPGTHFDLEKARNLPADQSSDRANAKVEQTLLEYARYPANIVRTKAEGWLGYQQRFPAILDKRIFLSVDEYAYFGGFGRPTTLRQALAYGMIFDEMLRYSDFMTMAAHTMGTSTLDISPTASTLNTLGLTFKVYADHFAGTIPVAVSGGSPQPAPKYPVGGDQPGVNSGSPTYPLDVFAALAPDRRSLTVAVVNATETAQALALSLSGRKLAGPGSLWQITAASPEAANRAGQPAEVELKQSPVGTAGALTVAPISINIYRFPVTE